MSSFTADFETTTDLDDCRVWAYAICEIGNPDNFIYGNNIEDFIKWCSDPKHNHKLFFHNLKFDSSFILYYLLSNGYTCIKDKKDRRDKTFTTLISDLGQFYSIEVYFKVGKKNVNKVTFYDSLKILNMSVDEVAKCFGLPISKLELDYKEFREIGHILTDEEIAYIHNDVAIMSLALDIMFKEKLTKMTIASDALHNYKELNKRFDLLFPRLPTKVHEDIRPSYKGGFTYLSDKYISKRVDDLIVLDVNSLYPSVLKNELLPFGNPIYFKGEYIYDPMHPLYIICFSCIFDIKEDKIPTVQIKDSVYFKRNEYLKSSDGDVVVLTMTNIDFELFKNHYNIEELTFYGGWKFKGKYAMFDEYINFWSDKKIQSKKDGNKALYTICKKMLNSLYGKFGSGCFGRSKEPYLNEDGRLAFKMGEKEERRTVYLPVASFVTSYARLKTISTSQKIREYTEEKYGKDYYIYSDTDSIHMLALPEEELKEFIDIDDYKLGAWKLESKAQAGLFLRQKCYIEQDYDGTINTTIAGLPKRMGKLITFDNFKIGFSTATFTDEEIKKMEEDTNSKIGRKLRFKNVKGGVVLVDTDFTIK